ncbi:PorT family protein [Pontibacter sp. KCTC 32443]|uniref:porin family protein n=1 Tax=Pontibacter TaxID=323449 RepID=UPI00164DA47E|nr:MULTISPECIES: porin family protein [Pontibacter]MBC5775893.1 PorT family protein [Pontibacter sp. KCTC 32443]
MKKLFLFVFAFCTVLMAQAQMSPRFGIKAGVNYAGLEGDDAGDNDRIFGAHAGVFVSLPLVEDFFSIKPEALYSMKGAESQDDDFELKLNYIDVPVLAQINAGPLYFEAGPQASFRVSGKIETDLGSTDDLEDLGYKSFLFGYAAGIGLASAPLGLSVGVRYSGDASKITDDDDTKIRNSVFMLTLGYMFPSR